LPSYVLPEIFEQIFFNPVVTHYIFSPKLSKFSHFKVIFEKIFEKIEKNHLGVSPYVFAQHFGKKGAM
jgi:hypothetical protein